MKILLLFFVTGVTYGWESHHLITAHTLSKTGSDKQVVYVPLEQALKKKLKRFPATTPSALRELLKIHKKWAFPLQLNEGNRKGVTKFEILQKYSDEPDWGLDQNLFEPDQYAELWTEDLKYVTQRTGLKSQAFRHCYFPGQFSWASPIKTFQIPMRPLGEGPRRALIYKDLALDFFEVGEAYWGYRFLAWSLHYIQDLFQPFHSNQTPSKRFIAFTWKGWLPAIDIETTGENIGYYHFAFEKWTDRFLKEADSPLAKVLEESSSPKIELTIENILADVVGYAGDLAPTVGSTSVDVFPKWSSKTDPLHRKSEDVVETDEWKASVKSHPKMETFKELTLRIFKRMGEFTRGVAQGARY